MYERQFNVDIYRPFSLPEYRDRTLYTTWDVTYSRLASDYPTAARLLRSFAFFDNQHLQFDLFCVKNDHSITRKLAKTGLKLYGLLRAQIKNDPMEWLSHISLNEFDSSMHVLVEYCFVEMRTTLKYYSIHSCVHDWALYSLDAETQSSGFWFAFDRIADMVDDLKGDRYPHSKYSAITPHAVRLTHSSFNIISQTTSSTRLDRTHSIAMFLHNQAQLDAANQMYFRALAGYEKALGQEHISTLDTVNNLGVLCRHQGKLAEAEDMYDRALAGYEKALGQEHISTLNIVHNLGVLYMNQGKSAEAEEMYNRALVGYEKALGQEHTSTLNIVQNLGILYGEQGRLIEAGQMYDRVLAGYEEALGQEHISTLNIVHNLGNLYVDQGKLVEAEQMYNRALAGYRKILSEQHPKMLELTLNQAGLLVNQRKLGDAKLNYEQIIAICERVLNDMASRSQSIIDTYAQALSKSMGVLRETRTVAQVYLLKLIELFWRQERNNMIVGLCFAKVLLYLKDDEKAKSVLQYIMPSEGNSMDLGRTYCDACLRRLSIDIGMNVCRQCVDTDLCDACLSMKPTDVHLLSKCQHGDFCNFGDAFRQALKSPRSDNSAARDAFLDELKQQYDIEGR